MDEFLARSKILAREEGFVWERLPEHSDSISYSQKAGSSAMAPELMKQILDIIDCDGLLKVRDLQLPGKVDTLLFDNYPGHPIIEYDKRYVWD